MNILKHKVIGLIKSFSGKDLEKLKKYISITGFTEGRNYIPLLNEILKHQSKGIPLAPSILYSSLYPGKKYSAQTLKNRLTELFRIIEEFIVFKRLNDDPIEKEKILLQEYIETGNYKLFDSKYKKIRKKAEELKESNHKFRHIQFFNDINLPRLNKSRSSFEKQMEQHIERSHYTFCLFLLMIFKDAVEFVVHEYNDIKVDSGRIRNMISSLNVEKYIEAFEVSGVSIEKAVAMNFYLYKAFYDRDREEYYFKMKKLFFESKDKFEEKYKEEIYANMITYCVMRQNEGIKKFQLELFNMYKEKLGEGLYSDFKQLTYPVNTFRDHVLIGIEVEEYKWVEVFIKTYCSELPPEIRDDETHLSYARLFFAQQKYEKAMEHLNRIRGMNYLHYTDASVLKMCCYYELEMYDFSFYEVDKFKHYLRNHKEIPEIHREPNLNFVNVYTRLVSNVTKLGREDLGFLEKEIREVKFISKGKWLLNKIGIVNV